MEDCSPDGWMEDGSERMTKLNEDKWSAACSSGIDMP